MTPTYAIVGAGFSGIAVAVQLLRRLAGPARICLINRNHRFGRGLAYGTRSGSHLLNVPAGRMSLDPDAPSDFADWLKSQGWPSDPSDFVSRKLYGDYLEATLELAQVRAAPGLRLELVQGEATDLRFAVDGQPTLHFADRPAMAPAEVVLAVGNYLPRSPCAAFTALRRPCVINDPWAGSALDGIRRDADVFLVGSGLTAYDVVLGLLDRGHTGPVTMLSRRGLLPKPHREQDVPPAPLEEIKSLLGLRKASEQLRGLRLLLADAARQGRDWRDVIAALRPLTPALWGQLDVRGRSQFLRHLLPYWETHRHRAAPAIAARMEVAIASGQVRVLSGRLLDLKVRPEEPLEVHWRARGQIQVQAESHGVVINCTGPSSDLRNAKDPLIQSMLSAGSLCVDALALGLETDAQYRVTTAEGQSLPNVRYVGPLLKAQWWEATAVPELRVHAMRVAGLLAEAQLASSTIKPV